VVKENAMEGLLLNRKWESRFSPASWGIKSSGVETNKKGFCGKKWIPSLPYSWGTKSSGDE